MIYFLRQQVIIDRVKTLIDIQHKKPWHAYICLDFYRAEVQYSHRSSTFIEIEPTNAYSRYMGRLSHISESRTLYTISVAVSREGRTARTLF